MEIEELDDCWMVNPPGGLHDTAAEALAWVKRRDRASADGGVSRVTVIEWVGRDVVRVLTGGVRR